MTPKIEKDVESFASGYEGEDRVLVRDIIDIIEMKGDAGIPAPDWVQVIKSLYPHRADVKEKCIEVSKTFERYIKRSSPGIYVFVPSGDADITDDIREAVGGQVELSYDILQFLKEKTELTERQWAEMVSNKYSIPPQLAVEFIRHVLHQFNGVIIKENNKWKYVPVSKTDPMELLRNITSLKYGDANDESDN